MLQYKTEHKGGVKNSKRVWDDDLKYGKKCVGKNPQPGGAFGGRFLAIFAPKFFLTIAFLVILGYGA